MKPDLLDATATPFSSTHASVAGTNGKGPVEGSVLSADISESAVLYKAPFQWKSDNRKRRFIRLSEREFSRETDWGIVCRSVELFLKQQDDRGSFYTQEDYLSGDRVDDQLGATSALAYFLSQTGPDEKISHALEKGVRFHLDHLVRPGTPVRPFRFSRYFIDRDSSGDWCNTNWSLAGGALTLLHGKPFLSQKTTIELGEVLRDYWSYMSSFSIRDENPCHNQLLAYCNIGLLLAKAVDDKAIRKQILEYYHTRLRKLRVYDRGHWIFSEFNQWDANYGVFSWTSLEELFAETGDPAFAEDAEEMALYFNELVSAGGYIWGGSRREEGGVDEFIQSPAQWASELGLGRLLLPEPAHLWRRLVMDGHYVKGVVHRMGVSLQPRTARRSLPPTPWHFQKDNVSVCLRNDYKLHQISSAGLEIIPAVGPAGIGTGVVWENDGSWTNDFLQAYPPHASEGHNYNVSKTLQFADVVGLTTTQRGYIWETRHWWMSTGESLVWIVQLITHSFPKCDKINFVLGNPILTRLANEAVPVTEVTSAEGARADTQGESISICSRKFLGFGDLHVGGTLPLKFVRPSKDAFHTFPVPGARLLREFTASNELRVLVSEKPVRLECRESIFFAVEFGKETPSLVAQRDPHAWNLETRFGCFSARQSDEIWNYTFGTASNRVELPQIGFGFRDS